MNEGDQDEDKAEGEDEEEVKADIDVKVDKPNCEDFNELINETEAMRGLEKK